MSLSKRTHVNSPSAAMAVIEEGGQPSLLGDVTRAGVERRIKELLALAGESGGISKEK